MSRLDFTGRVAVVTGAGGGLGREYALLFASRGATVIVNDLGGSLQGDGNDSRPADTVVSEIKAKGGKAVANYDSVEEGEKIVETAIGNFGRIDILVNNAGNLRDKSFGNMSAIDWDLVQRVHLRGAFLVTRAAWPHMRKQKYGRIIMTSSPSGVYGNFGQANYSAAKSGLIGLSRTLAIEGAKYGIQCNSLLPSAGSRMTSTAWPAGMVEAMKAEYVAPLVIYLCHESCKETGCVFETAAGWVGKLRWQKSKGKVIREAGKPMVLEDIRDAWADIVDMSEASYPKSIGEGMDFLLNIIQDVNDQKELETNETSSRGLELTPLKTNGASVDFTKALAARFPPVKYEYTSKDVICYNLGVGISLQQKGGLRFLYEGHEAFSAWPSFAVIPAHRAHMGVFSGMVQDIGVNIFRDRILHGEQYFELYEKLPTEGTLTTTFKIVDVLDKKSGAVGITDAETFDENGRRIAYNQFVNFMVGAGGFGGKKNSPRLVPCLSPPSNRKPDSTIEDRIPKDQAALYRLSGDTNPLHIDPKFAADGGFSAPILHGLCSYGYALRHVLQQYADNDATRFKAMKARFSKPVYPGQTLQTNMWKDGLRIYFLCKVKETGDQVLTGAYVDLHDSSSATSRPLSKL